MYGHITGEHIVGQLFEEMPDKNNYHPDFIARIIELPPGIGSRWRYVSGEFFHPTEEPEPEPLTYAELAQRVSELEQIISTQARY